MPCSSALTRNCVLTQMEGEDPNKVSDDEKPAARPKPELLDGAGPGEHQLCWCGCVGMRVLSTWVWG